jgi:hypothetical protein
MIGVKLVYVLMQLMLLGLGVWKVNAMGLLPYGVLFPLPCCPSKLCRGKLTFCLFYDLGRQGRTG